MQHKEDGDSNDDMRIKVKTTATTWRVYNEGKTGNKHNNENQNNSDHKGMKGEVLKSQKTNPTISGTCLVLYFMIYVSCLGCYVESNFINREVA